MALCHPSSPFSSGSTVFVAFLGNPELATSGRGCDGTLCALKSGGEKRRGRGDCLFESGGTSNEKKKTGDRSFKISGSVCYQASSVRVEPVAISDDSSLLAHEIQFVMAASWERIHERARVRTGNGNLQRHHFAA